MLGWTTNTSDVWSTIIEEGKEEKQIKAEEYAQQKTPECYRLQLGEAIIFDAPWDSDKPFVGSSRLEGHVVILKKSWDYRYNIKIQLAGNEGALFNCGLFV